MKNKLLVAWAVVFGLGLLATYGFVNGLIRDTHIGQPTMTLPLDRVGQHTTDFRVWGKTEYVLRLSASSSDPTKVGLRLDAALEVVVRSPDGAVALQQAFDGTRADFRLSQYTDVRLATVVLHGSPWRRWSLETRVTRPDQRFEGVITQIKLWEYVDVGMGGLLNYVLVIPAGVLMLAALGMAIRLAMRGRTVPLFCTVPAVLALFALFVA